MRVTTKSTLITHSKYRQDVDGCEKNIHCEFQYCQKRNQTISMHGHFFITIISDSNRERCRKSYKLMRHALTTSHTEKYGDLHLQVYRRRNEAVALRQS